MKRILFGIILFVSIILLPFYIPIIIGICGAILFPFYYEAIIGAFFLELLYNGAPTFLIGIPYPLTISVLILLFSIIVIRKVFRQ